MDQFLQQPPRCQLGRTPKMQNWQAPLRLAFVFAVAAFIALAASVYEIDRREKSSAATITANFSDLDQRVQALTAQIRILHNEYEGHLAANQRTLRALTNQTDALNQYDARLRELEDASRGRR